MFVKAAKAQGLSNFELAQMRYYAEELRGGTFAVGAPTDHVELVSGRPAEEFEITARRYISNPDLISPGLTAGGKLGASWLMLKTMLSRSPDLDRWESERDVPKLAEPVLAHDSEEWLASAERKQLALLEQRSNAESARPRVGAATRAPA